MFAIVRTGGKQYRVAAGDIIAVEKLAGEAGDSITLDDVLLAGDGGDMKDLKGLTVAAEIIAQEKGEKVIIFKKRRRHNYRRKNGHRQQHTVLKISAIGSEKAPAKAAPKKEAAPAAEKPAAEAKAAPAEKAPAKKAAAKTETKPAAAKKAPAKKPAAKKPAAKKED
ncbi:50S ribosomal protein L21 [uncultured Parasphingorhabdus sp.]|uniref:50S ribosomal protein L21 n=1 Tax=uncultured Parasphingorhabdus sp. TaxID=2709694 RepID=UPI0030DDA92A|tara:strand:+ start:14906 stop:15406 length:501 start_codon:yes stop_codon:yes gene_type:complete